MTVDAGSFHLPPTPSRLLSGEPPFLYAVAFWLALVQISIAASQIVLAVLVALWLYLIFREEAPWVSLPFDLPFGLYAGFTVAAAVFSFDPWASLPATKKLLLLVVPYLLVSTVRRVETFEHLVLILVGVADLASLLGLWQYAFGDVYDANHRIRGFMGHYMTYSGQLMAVGILAFARLLFGGSRSRFHGFFLGSFLLIQAALVLTLTRSAWIGALVAVVVLLVVKNWKLLLFVPFILGGVSLLLPSDVERRVVSLITPDVSGWDRVYMLRAGSRMVGHHPLLGVGPEMVADVYPLYVDADARRRDNPHLHNNLVQIAAERGLPCLVAWMWILAAALVIAVRELRRTGRGEPARALAAGSLGVLIAGMVAGLFEYNFGDSEFQMLFLFAMSVPLVLERARKADVS